MAYATNHCDTRHKSYITRTISLRQLLIYWSSVVVLAKCQTRRKLPECLENKSRMFSRYASPDKMEKGTSREGCDVLKSCYITQCLKNPLQCWRTVAESRGGFSLQRILLQLVCSTVGPRGMRSTRKYSMLLVSLCRRRRLKERCHGTFYVSAKNYTEILFSDLYCSRKHCLRT